MGFELRFWIENQKIYFRQQKLKSAKILGKYVDVFKFTLFNHSFSHLNHTEMFNNDESLENFFKHFEFVKFCENLSFFFMKRPRRDPFNKLFMCAFRWIPNKNLKSIFLVFFNFSKLFENGKQREWIALSITLSFHWL